MPVIDVDDDDDFSHAPSPVTIDNESGAVSPQSSDGKRMVTSPIEEIFGLPACSTESTLQIANSPEMVAQDEAEEAEILTQLNTVYSYAVDAFEAQNDMAQSVDPKFAARNAEVAAQYLKIALDAVSTRVGNRDRREKRKGGGGGGGQTADQINNNIIVADRNELLRIIKGQNQ